MRVNAKSSVALGASFASALSSVNKFASYLNAESPRQKLALPAFGASLSGALLPRREGTNVVWIDDPGRHFSHDKRAVKDVAKR